MTTDAAAPSPSDTVERRPSARALKGLDALNFFLADVRDGLGPYLAIYLIAVRGPNEGWNEATTGLVMTIAGIVGLIAQTPAGALIDRTGRKRMIVIAGAVAVTLSCLALPFVSNFYVVAATQSVAAIAGAIFAPAIAAITLGVVGPKAFAKRVGRNEGFNHAGNAVSAAIAAGLRGSAGMALSPNPGRSGQRTGRSAASAGMVRTQWRQEPEPPWNSTSGVPWSGPQRRQTMWPSPHGVACWRAVASSNSSGDMDPA